MHQGKTRGPSLQVAERRRFVFTLRKVGTSYRTIYEAALRRFGDTLPRSYNPRHVCEDVLLVLREMQTELDETAALVRQLELQRLDDMQAGIWARARSGDDCAVLVVLRLMERRSRLLGLDGPTKIARVDPPEQPTTDPARPGLEDDQARWAASVRACVQLLGA